MNAKQYATWLRKQAIEIPERVAMPVFRRRAFKVLELTVQNTPANFGVLRSGWHLTIATKSGEDRSDPNVKSGAAAARAAMRAGESVINKVRFGEGIWFQNNVPHARVIEDGLYKHDTPPGGTKALHVPKSRRKRVEGTILVKGGFHVSAPNGMLADAVQQVAELARAGAL